MTDYAELAESRVIAEEKLSPFHDLLIARDWGHHDDHMQWVATGAIVELVAWAEDIRRDEADEADEEPFTYSLSEPRTITAYPDQWAVVDRLAAERHRGKASPAVQEIIDAYKDALGTGGLR